MARIRSIHPGIWTDEAFMTASPHARLLVMGIWCEAFDDGVFEWKPLTLKVRIFPVDNVDLAALLAEIEALGFVRKFEVGGKTYGLVRNFRRFQRPKKPNTSGVLSAEFRTYVGLNDDGSEPVGNQDGTDGEKSPQMEEGGGKREENTEEPIGSSDADASRRDRSRDALISEARPVLMSMGVSKGGAASMIGRWLRDTGDDHARVLGAISRAREQCPHEPLAWITAHLKETAHARRTDRNDVFAALDRFDERIDALG